MASIPSSTLVIRVEAPEVKIYSDGESSGVMLLVIAGIISIIAVVSVTLYYIVFTKRTKTFHRTNIAPYLVSLLLANVLQAVATILNANWVRKGIVFDGSFCAFQGGLKNAANVGTALWSFMIALHVFNLLFLRWRTKRTSMYATLIGGWSTVVMIVTLGPTIIETPEKGPYFGVSGYWCWITEAYPKEQTFLEYFFEFLSAGLGFVLYALVLLRVRGNLVMIGGRWQMRWIPRSQAWQLSIGRDMLDTAMLRVATNMVWYPVAYSLIIIPVALARLSSFNSHHVPFWATITTDVIFNLTGLVNSILLVTTRSVLPDTATLPNFTTPRKRLESDSDSGITPFAISSITSGGSNSGNHSRNASEVSRSRPSMSGVTPFVLPPVSQPPVPQPQSLEQSAGEQNEHRQETFASDIMTDGGSDEDHSADLGPAVQPLRYPYTDPSPTSSVHSVPTTPVPRSMMPVVQITPSTPDTKETFRSSSVA